MRDEKPKSVERYMAHEGQKKAEVVIEFVIHDSQIVDVKAKLERQNYRWN